MHPTTFYEIGHFYSDELITANCLKHLNQIPIDHSKNNKLSFFIDDYNVSETKLDLSLLVMFSQDVFQQEVEIHFENDMVQYYDRVLQLLSTNDLVTTKYQRGRVEKQELALGDYRITLGETYPNFKPTCAMLSLTWSLFRLGMFEAGASTNDIMTCIHNKYEVVERKVEVMLEYIKQKHEVKNEFKYFFYE